MVRVNCQNGDGGGSWVGEPLSEHLKNPKLSHEKGSEILPEVFEPLFCGSEFKIPPNFPQNCPPQIFYIIHRRASAGAQGEPTTENNSRGVSLRKTLSKGGGKLMGGEKHTIRPLPQKQFWNPPPMIRSPPPGLFTPCHFLRRNGHRPDHSHFLRPPKLVLEGRHSIVCFPPQI